MSNELAHLIAEQEKDQRWGHRVDARGPSLDYEFESGGSFGDIVGYSAAPGDTAVRKIPRPQKWTRRQIIVHIRRWVEEHGEIPTHKDWNRVNGRGIPAAASVVRKFGSWDAGIAAAGFEPRGVGGHRHATPGSKVRPRIRRKKRTARLNADQLAAAWVLYDRKKMSVPEIAALLWERYGYPSPLRCKEALRNGFIAEGFTLRTKSEARMCLSPEHRARIAANARAARKRIQRGEDNPKAKLNEADVRLILVSRETTAALARHYGVSQPTIASIRKGRTWRHVTGEVVL